MFVDYHVHTAFSDDSIYPMEKVIQDAITMKMDEICFTEHVDYGIKVDWDSGQKIIYRGNEPMANADYPEYMKAIQAMKEKYGHQITIKTGLEFGMQTHTISQFQKLFDRYDFDFIILSIHQVHDKEFWNQEFQKGKTQKEYNEEYYKEMLDVIRQYKDYSVLGRMDLINRYDNQGIYPFEKVKLWIQAILEQVIADGKGIEINTSSKRYGLKDTTPSRQILELYKDLGGTILTIGSDSHKPEHLGAHIQDSKKMLQEIGFKQYCTFDHMNPVFHDLDR
ncbi:histidinol-phosphatase HisJ family protein [Faecalicoccus pleomorphus]|uniref:histidinol-phosphatase HisJ family protein n=1 Tax=Faecalicoccus pleomorphus TaxID=1323 RepID=UPI00195F4D79|nr:histidinol-phosphatase HisJ family protein [Faecalicoccus pleomorphus]MBM6678130.1 histidinol-phosphatase HisJ family protein [Faecalicoccus pleomorphus]